MILVLIQCFWFWQVSIMIRKNILEITVYLKEKSYKFFYEIL